MLILGVLLIYVAAFVFIFGVTTVNDVISHYEVNKIIKIDIRKSLKETTGLFGITALVITLVLMIVLLVGMGAYLISGGLN